VKTPTEIQIDPDITSGTVTLHARYSGSRFMKTETREFPDYHTANQWCREQILMGAQWMRLDSTPTTPMPDLKAWKTGEQLTVAVDGHVIAETDSPRVVREALSRHPELLSVPCARCGGLPRVDLCGNVLSHMREGKRGKRYPAEGCDKLIYLEEPRVPMAQKIHAWNTCLGPRVRKLRMDPVTIPHLLEMGILREPTMKEVEARIRRVEVL
jgi:hypothetical protein